MNKEDEIRLALNKVGIVTHEIHYENRSMDTPIYGFRPSRPFVSIRGELTNTPIVNLNSIQKVVANEKNGYTIVKFIDGTVSKVKCNNEDFDLEKAVAMAITKRLIGNNNFYKALENATVIKKEEK